MEAGDSFVQQDQLGPDTALAVEVGKVAGAVTVLAGEVSAMRNELTGFSGQLADGSVRMGKIDSQVEQLVEQVRVANGRTAKNENRISALFKRMGDVERKWNSITFIPRTLDKLAEHKTVGLMLTIPLTAALTIFTYNLLG